MTFDVHSLICDIVIPRQKTHHALPLYFYEVWWRSRRMTTLTSWETCSIGIMIRRINTSTTNFHVLVQLLKSLGEAERAPWLERWKVCCSIFIAAWSDIHLHIQMSQLLLEGGLRTIYYQLLPYNSEWIIFSRLSDSWFTSQCFIALG